MTTLYGNESKNCTFTESGEQNNAVRMINLLTKLCRMCENQQFLKSLFLRLCPIPLTKSFNWIIGHLMQLIFLSWYSKTSFDYRGWFTRQFNTICRPAQIGWFDFQWMLKILPILSPKSRHYVKILLLPNGGTDSTPHSYWIVLNISYNANYR